MARAGGSRSHNIRQLGRKLGVGAELEGLHPVRLQTVFLPDAVHGSRGDTYFARQTTRTPVGRVFWRPQRGCNYRLFLGSRELWRPASTRSGAQRIDSSLPITPSADGDRVRRNLEPAREWWSP